MTTYIVHSNNAVAKTAAVILLINLRDRIKNPVEREDQVMHGSLPGNPMGLSVEAGSKIYFVDHPITKEVHDYYIRNLVDISFIGHKTPLYEHFGIDTDKHPFVSKDRSTPFLAYAASGADFNTASGFIADMDKEIMSGEKGPYSRFMQANYDAGTYEKNNYALYYTELCAYIGAVCGKNINLFIDNEVKHFIAMKWYAKIEDVREKFELDQDVNCYAMQHPASMAEEKVRAVMDHTGCECVITWIITQQRVTFVVYSRGINALVFANKYLPTGTDSEAGFSMPVAAGLKIIQNLLGK